MIRHYQPLVLPIMNQLLPIRSHGSIISQLSTNSLAHQPMTSYTTYLVNYELISLATVNERETAINIPLVTG